MANLNTSKNLLNLLPLLYKVCSNSPNVITAIRYFCNASVKFYESRAASRELLPNIAYNRGKAFSVNKKSCHTAGDLS